jgi:hypothetical protein
MVSALIHSDSARPGALEHHRSIKLSTYGIIFMGTPHQGGNGVAFGNLLANIASVFVPADDRLLRHLERDSEWLQQQLGQYGPISSEFVTKFAYEEYPTPTVLGHSVMVSLQCLLIGSILKRTGCVTGIRRCSRSCRCRAYYHACGSRQYGKVQIPIGRRI